MFIFKLKLVSCLLFFCIITIFSGKFFINYYLHSLKRKSFIEVWNSGVSKSSYETELCKMMSHFELLTQDFL